LQIQTASAARSCSSAYTGKLGDGAGPSVRAAIFEAVVKNVGERAEEHDSAVDSPTYRVEVPVPVQIDEVGAAEIADVDPGERIRRPDAASTNAGLLVFPVFS
jgi:hypothetical protein